MCSSDLPGGALPGAVRDLGAAALLALPLVIFNAGATLLDPFFREWSAQNTILSPHPLHYLAAYAIYLPWAYRGARRLLAGGGLPGRLPVIWVLVVPIMVYLPVNLQRRLAEGVFVALLALFVVGLDAGAARGRPLRHLVPLVVAALLTTLLLLAGAGRTAWYPTEPAFRPAAETEAFGYLAEAAPPGSVVLAPVPIGNALPAFAPMRVVIGHGPESIGFAQLRPQVEAFFEGRLTGAEAMELLVDQGVDYVFWSGAVVPLMAGLEPLYVNGEVTLYEYRPP